MMRAPWASLRKAATSSSRSRSRRRRALNVARLHGVERLEERTLLSTFTVTNTADSGPNSLRQAIMSANSNSGPHTINFNIPGTGVQTISPATAYPALTQPTTINGYSQPGTHQNTLANGNDAVLLIELDGS